MTGTLLIRSVYGGMLPVGIDISKEELQRISGVFEHHNGRPLLYEDIYRFDARLTRFVLRQPSMPRIIKTAEEIKKEK